VILVILVIRYHAARLFSQAMFDTTDDP